MQCGETLFCLRVDPLRSLLFNHLMIVKVQTLYISAAIVYYILKNGKCKVEFALLYYIGHKVTYVNNVIL